MKFVISSLEEVAEGLRGEYEPKDGKFVLRVEGDIPALVAANAKIVEFRDNNIRLKKRNEELEPLATKYEGIDPDEARANAEKVKALGKKGVKDADDFDTRLKAAVDEAVKPLKDQIAAGQAEAKAERERGDEFLLNSHLTTEFTKQGGKPNAANFVVGLAKEFFEVKDKTVVAKTGKFSTEKPGEALTPAEWLSTHVKSNHDYVFEPSVGGGATGKSPSAKNGEAVVLAPGQTLLKNPTPQDLGRFSADIAAGKVKVAYDQPAVATQ